MDSQRNWIGTINTRLFLELSDNGIFWVFTIVHESSGECQHIFARLMPPPD
jgi:hypothetical protein